MQHYFESFRFCPRCGKEYRTDEFTRPATMFRCGGCAFEFYQNTKPAIGVIIPDGGDPARLLFTCRNLEPGKGKLDFPGGFINYHEDPVQSCLREIREELKIEATIQRLFHVNLLAYPYQGSLQSVMTLFYLAAPVAVEPGVIGDEENSECRFHGVLEIMEHPEYLAFPSDREAVEKYTREILHLPAGENDGLKRD
jgi:ADP-ribose pyrophosphatase YjhB (NUDIX family)